MKSGVLLFFRYRLRNLRQKSTPPTHKTPDDGVTGSCDSCADKVLNLTQSHNKTSQFLTTTGASKQASKPIMLDVQDFITVRGGDPEKIRQSQIKRGAPVEIVDEIITLWETHRTTNYAGMQVGTQINAVQKEIGQKKKAKESADDLLEKKKELELEKASKLEKAAELLKELNAKLKTVGNYVHDAVPVSQTEDDNVVLREWKPETSQLGDFEKPDQILSHHQVLTRIGGYEPERGTKIAGHRGYCLTGYGVFLYVLPSHCLLAQC